MIVLARAGLELLAKRREEDLAVFAYKFVHRTLPTHLSVDCSHWFAPKPDRAASLRSADLVRLPRAKKEVLKRSPFYMSLSVWNALPSKTRSSKSVTGLRNAFLAK